ncbi:MAG: addiction module antidote protein [Candidatus Binatia bacterium]
MSKPYRDYHEGLIEALNDPDEAAEYLNAALEERDQAAFLKALRNVVQARGMTATAQATGLNREGLYRMLSKRGNPELASLERLLESLGLRLTVQASGREAVKDLSP